MTTQKSTTNKPAIGSTYGDLTVTEVRPDSLLTTKCKCGFPALVIPTSVWGLVLGCAACHSELAEAARVEAEREEREQAARERAERREAQDRDIHYNCHYEELARADKLLFRYLSKLFQFDRNSVSNYLRCSTEEAWRAIQRLLDANLLVEREKLPFTGIRPYRLGQNYGMLASPSSQYSVRAAAVAQMEKLEPTTAQPTPTAAEEPAPEQVDPSDTALEDVHAFLAEMTVPKGSESNVVLNARYADWCSDHGHAALALDELGKALDGMGHTLRNGKWMGLRLKLAREMGGRQ